MLKKSFWRACATFWRWRKRRMGRQKLNTMVYFPPKGKWNWLRWPWNAFFGIFGMMSCFFLILDSRTQDSATSWTRMTCSLQGNIKLCGSKEEHSTFQWICGWTLCVTYRMTTRWRPFSSVNLQVYMCSYGISDLYIQVLCMYIQAQYRHICICTEMHVLFICQYVYVWFIYVCIHLYMSVCAYNIPICIYAYICTYLYVYAWIVCICMYLCLQLYAPVYVCMCMYTYVFVCISMYMCISLQYIHIAHTSVCMLILRDAFYSMRRAGYVCV